MQIILFSHASLLPQILPSFRPARAILTHLLSKFILHCWFLFPTSCNTANSESGCLVFTAVTSLYSRWRFKTLKGSRGQGLVGHCSSDCRLKQRCSAPVPPQINQPPLQCPSVSCPCHLLAFVAFPFPRLGFLSSLWNLAGPWGDVSGKEPQTKQTRESLPETTGVLSGDFVPGGAPSCSLPR